MALVQFSRTKCQMIVRPPTVKPASCEATDDRTNRPVAVATMTTAAATPTGRRLAVRTRSARRATTIEIAAAYAGVLLPVARRTSNDVVTVITLARARAGVRRKTSTAA